LQGRYRNICKPSFLLKLMWEICAAATLQVVLPSTYEGQVAAATQQLLLEIQQRQQQQQDEQAEED
jgi:hypothetical protein